MFTIALAVESTAVFSKERNNRHSEDVSVKVMDEVSFEGKKYVALKESIGNLPLIVIRAKKGYIACSYIDMETAEKVGDVAAFVSGVKDYDDLKKAKIRSATTWAEDLGIREGMSVKKALELMDELSE